MLALTNERGFSITYKRSFTAAFDEIIAEHKISASYFKLEGIIDTKVTQ